MEVQQQAEVEMTNPLVERKGTGPQRGAPRGAPLHRSTTMAASNVDVPVVVVVVEVEVGRHARGRHAGQCSRMSSRMSSRHTLIIPHALSSARSKPTLYGQGVGPCSSDQSF
jgi:hypothetical protein